MSQLHNEIFRPIAYASRRLSVAEKNYTTSEKEALSAFYSLKEFNDFTYGREIELFTDHEPLTTLKSLKNQSTRLSKHMMKIQEIAPDLLIKYKPGHLNVEADMLSRAKINQVSLHSNLNWSFEQEKDKNLFELKCLLKNKNQFLSDWAVSEDQFKKRAIQLFDKLEIENETIKFKNEPKLIFVPNHKIQDVLKTFHDDPLSGHLAYDKTLNRIKVRFFLV